MKEIYDIIIIGKGPAAISASIYTSRSNYSTLVIGKESLLEKADKIDNYFGFQETISGKDLLINGVEQTKKFGTEIIENEVIDIEIDDNGERPNGYIVTVAGNVNVAEAKLKCKAILLAVGQTRNKVSIKNLETFEGNGVSYCVLCDGFFFKNKKVGLIGATDYMVHEAENLKNFTNQVCIYSNGKELNQENIAKLEKLDFKIDKREIDSIEGSLTIETIKFKDGTKETIEGIFIANGTASSINFGRKLGLKIENDSIVVDKNQYTGVNGIFAAGDCTGGLKQIAVAVGEGAVAGVSIISYMKNTIIHEYRFNK